MLLPRRIVRASAPFAVAGCLPLLLIPFMVVTAGCSGRKHNSPPLTNTYATLADGYEGQTG
ncbi:MAG: hypothetical protein DRP63_00990 [Planctomycetota bacterium]|nr:MAG: hypothetical protein DRP63_00990 [Planctomycetota bacterium]